jgi:preprotein translocase subunit SecD
VKNPDEAERVLKEVAVLAYKIVPPDVAQKATAALTVIANPSLPAKDRAAAEAYVANGAYDASGPVVYSGKDLKAAQAGFDTSGQPNVLFQTKDPSRFGKLTTANIGKLLGIFLDHRFVEAPVIQGAIFDSGEIHGTFT